MTLVLDTTADLPTNMQHPTLRCTPARPVTLVIDRPGCAAHGDPACATCA